MSMREADHVLCRTYLGLISNIFNTAPICPAIAGRGSSADRVSWHSGRSGDEVMSKKHRTSGLLSKRGCSRAGRWVGAGFRLSWWHKHISVRLRLVSMQLMSMRLSQRRYSNMLAK